MGNWNGSVTLYADCVRNPTTGDYLRVESDDLPDEAETWPLLEVTIEFSGSSWYSPGRSYGHPEDCYPEEGGTEIDSRTATIKVDGKTVTLPDFTTTAAEDDEASEAMQEYAIHGED